MSKRQKKKVITEVNRETMEEAFAAYNKTHSRLEILQGKMNSEITKIKEKFDGEISTLQEEKDEHFELIQAYAESHPELFEKKKSIELTHGTFGFRTGTPKLKTRKGFTWEAVKTLVQRVLPSYIRTEETIAKDMLLADREKDAVKNNLQDIGLEVIQEETFFVQSNLEQVAAV